MDTRRALIDSGNLVDEGAHYRLIKDQVFTSSSGAASFVLASSASGFLHWKDAEGRKLGDLGIPTSFDPA